MIKRVGSTLSAGVALSLLMVASVAHATTKGLNQIVTPDVQPLGQISLSLQAQHPAIGNGFMLQTEVGLTDKFELAAFYGTKPGMSFLNGEYALYQRGNALLSTGFTSWNTKGNNAQPFIEAGYYRGRQKYSVGLMYANDKTETLLGALYQLKPNLALQLDWQSGDENYLSGGVNLNITDALSLNPAIYVANSSDHSLYGYAVLTWTFTGWKK